MGESDMMKNILWAKARQCTLSLFIPCHTRFIGCNTNRGGCSYTRQYMAKFIQVSMFDNAAGMS